MTDEDVVSRAAAMMNGSVRKSVSPSRLAKIAAGEKQTFITTVHGANARRAMRMVLPYMGERRAKKIQDCLAKGNQDS